MKRALVSLQTCSDQLFLSAASVSKKHWTQSASTVLVSVTNSRESDTTAQHRALVSHLMLLWNFTSSKGPLWSKQESPLVPSPAYRELAGKKSPLKARATTPELRPCQCVTTLHMSLQTSPCSFENLRHVTAAIKCAPLEKLIFIPISSMWCLNAQS